ncbi:hypothetical protein Tco_0965382 [Tanacetum coccineum]
MNSSSLNSFGTFGWDPTSSLYATCMSYEDSFFFYTEILYLSNLRNAASESNYMPLSLVTLAGAFVFVMFSGSLASLTGGKGSLGKSSLLRLLACLGNLSVAKSY